MESAGLLEQLGINWKLLASQAVNFFVLIAVLKIFVYTPLMRIIKERQAKIQAGLDMAQESEVRLKEVDAIALEHFKKAEEESRRLLHESQRHAETLRAELEKKARDNEKELARQSLIKHEKHQEELRRALVANARSLVKDSIARAVEISPNEIDEALVEQALAHIRKQISHEKS